MTSLLSYIQFLRIAFYHFSSAEGFINIHAIAPLALELKLFIIRPSGRPYNGKF